MIRVFIANDHPLVLQTMIDILERESDIEIVGTATDGIDVVSRALELNADVVIIDSEMPHCPGQQAAQLLKKQNAAVKVISLGISTTEPDVLPVGEDGVDMFFRHSISVPEIIDAVHELAARR